MNTIEAWYDTYDEWSRFDHQIAEFAVTKRHLDRFIVGENLRIFDIGGGPGRYALYLAEKGHRVTLLDLTSKHLEIAKAKAEEMGIQLEGFIHGNALGLGEWEPIFDVVLLMGPLYHLIRLEDRKQAVQEALRVLKPGGLIAAAFISQYAPLYDGLLSMEDVKDPGQFMSYLENGVNRPEEGFTEAYFTSPDEARDLMAGFGLEELVFAGVENVLSTHQAQLGELDETMREKWLDVAYRLSTDKNLIGYTHHYLYLGQKPLN